MAAHVDVFFKFCFPSKLLLLSSFVTLFPLDFCWMFSESECEYKIIDIPVINVTYSMYSPGTSLISLCVRSVGFFSLFLLNKASEVSNFFLFCANCNFKMFSVGWYLKYLLQCQLTLETQSNLSVAETIFIFIISYAVRDRFWPILSNLGGLRMSWFVLLQKLFDVGAVSLWRY